MQLSRESIIAEALAILSQYGLGDLTMRRLARQLDVVPGALYWHVPNKQSLLEAIAEEIVRPVLSASSPENPQALQEARFSDFAAMLNQLRQAMLSVRDGAEVVSAAISVGTLHERILEQLCSTLDTPDVDMATKRLCAATAIDFVMGSTAIEQAQLQFLQVTGTQAEDNSTGNAPNLPPFDERLQLVLHGVAAHMPLK